MLVSICNLSQVLGDDAAIQVQFLFIMRESVLHLYKTMGRIIILYILIFKFLDGRLEDYMKYVE